MKTQDKTVRDQLKAVREDISTARDDLPTLNKAIDETKEAFASKHGDSAPAELKDSPEFKAAQDAVAARGEKLDEIADLQESERGLLGLLGESTPDPRGNGPSDERSRANGGWDAEGLLAGEAYQELKESGIIDSKSKLGTVQLGRLADRDSSARFLAADIGSDNMTGAIPADRRGIVTPNLKRLTLLDLIPIGTTDSDIVQYVQVLTIPEQAAEVPETGSGEDAALKPEASFTTRDADAPVRMIAAWLKLRRRALRDVSGLQSLISILLPHDVRRRLESQILVGDGEDDTLKGILNTDGIGAPEFETGDNIADAILRAITTVVLSDGDPNFVALHPLAQQDLMMMRENGGNDANRSGAYLYGSPASPAAPTIWGLAMTSNRAVPQPTPLVGDSMGASILVREGMNVLVSDSDGDDFRRNRVTVLAEQPVAFPVWRPSSFAVAQTEEGS